MQEIKFKIKNTEFANVEIVPVSDGIEIVVRYGGREQAGEGRGFKEKGKEFKERGRERSADEVIDQMKEYAREEYKKPGADKAEITKFVKFWEAKIENEGWKGEFKFDMLYDRWLKNKR